MKRRTVLLPVAVEADIPDDVLAEVTRAAVTAAAVAVRDLLRASPDVDARCVLLTDVRLDEDASVAGLDVYDGTMLHNTHDCLGVYVTDVDTRPASDAGAMIVGVREAVGQADAGNTMSVDEWRGRKGR